MIGCVYAQNFYMSTFYSKLISDVSSLSTPITILGGDFNCVVNPELDHNPPLKTPPPKKVSSY